MIKSLKIDVELIKNTKEYDYISSLALFKDHNFNFQFKPGLNIIMCENGAGKSTLLDMLGKATFSRKYGYSNIDKEMMHSSDFLKHVTEEDIEKKRVSCHSTVLNYMRFFNVEKDENITLYCNPKFIVGANGETTNTYRPELFALQKNERINLKGSTGIKNKSRMELINKALNGDINIKKIFSPDVNKYIEQTRFRSYKDTNVNAEFLKSTIENNQMTILIDEPESGLDLRSKIEWFKTLEEKIEKQNLQVIMITHEDIVLKMKNVNFIETNGYVDSCIQILKGNNNA